MHQAAFLGSRPAARNFLLQCIERGLHRQPQEVCNAAEPVRIAGSNGENSNKVVLEQTVRCTGPCLSRSMYYVHLFDAGKGRRN